ncbi:MAG: DNA mismatch repair protein MutS, partial [Proteobacteria bacterium]
LLQYLFKNQNRTRLPNLRAPVSLRASKHLRLGPKTVSHLDLLPRRDRMSARSLFEWCNETKTAMGGRLLREWILAPLMDLTAIQSRQSAVKLISERRKSSLIFEKLSRVYDIERVLGKVSNRLATPRDTLSCARSTLAILELKPLLTELAPFSSELASILAAIEQGEVQAGPLAEKTIRIQREDAPLLARDGKIFQSGYQSDLDRLIEITERGDRWLIDLEEKERARTSIPSLKVRYNRVFGYYIEITTTHLKNAPSDYMRKQTTAGGERFFTEELKRFEDDRISAEEKRKALEVALFEELNAEIEAASTALLKLSEAVARLDVLTSFSRYLDRPGPYVFPEINDGLSFDVECGRHPLVDKGDGSFIPNSLSLGHERTLLITGPNMGGKSTVMRQFAILVLLGQMGAPIPAEKASWGVVDALFTRIGAEDAIFEGQSTFMVEMTELAHLLHHATPRSFLILDEIGRGTSTYDGLSVAWSSIEWISNKIESRTLFATHYHELTELPLKHSKLRNAHMAVEQSKTGLRFLYELKAGPSSESFGIQVAKLAGLPRSVIERATQILRGLENGATKSGKHGTSASIDQLSLFTAMAHAEPSPPEIDLASIDAFLEELENFPVLDTTPLQALDRLGKLKDQARTLRLELVQV